MKFRDKLIISAIAASLFFLMIYAVRSVLAPFILSFIIAYLLNPLTTYLTCKTKLSRLFVTSLIIGLFFAILTMGSIFLVPMIFAQFDSFTEELPNYLQIFATDFYPKIVAFAAKFGVVLQNDIFALIKEWDLNARFLSFSQDFLSNLLNSTLGLINVLSLIFITPILVFYLLNDWEILVAKVRAYLPKKSAGEIEKIFAEIDVIMSGYIHGQVNVCLILGVIYGSLLSFCDLNFGFLIGFLTGIFAFIPYVGMLCGVTCATIVALFQWGFDSFHIALIAGVFTFGQILESNFLTPKLIGKKIGLHPIWVIFGLFFFGAIFGFVGVLAAVPATAICGVIIRYFALKYKKNFT